MVKHLIRWVVCLCLCATGINTAWADTTTELDFSKIDGSSWGTSYNATHTETYKDLGTATFNGVSQQTANSNCKGLPVFKNKDTGLTFMMVEGLTIKKVVLNCRYWKSCTLTLYTSSNGTDFSKENDFTVTSTSEVFSTDNLSGITAIKYIITSSGTKSNVGMASLTITYNNSNDLRPAVDIATFQTTDGSTKLGIYKSIGTVVSTYQTGWTPAEENVPYTYSSSATSNADIDANGVIYAKKVGKATITAKANVADGGTYQSGKSKSIEIEVVDNRKKVNLTEFKATNDNLLVGNSTTTTVSNDQSEWTPKYTYESKDTTVAEVNAEGVVIGKASGTAKIVVTANIEEKDPDFKADKTTTKDITITVKNPSHKVTFMVNGTEASNEDIEEGKSITFPTPDESQLADNLVFAGWSTSNLDSMVYNAPELVDTKNAIMGKSEVTYYAVFARIAQTGTSESDVLTSEIIQNKLNKSSHGYGKEVTYQNGSVTWLTDSYIEKAGDNYLQINSNKGSSKGTYVGFETTYSIKTVKFELANSSSVTIYVKKVPTKISSSGTIVKSISLSSAKSGEISLDGDYTKLYLQSSGAIQITSVTIIGNVSEPSYAGYVTDSVAAKTSRTHVVTVADCGYTSVCLPYNAVASEGATLYALKSVDQNGLHFSKTNTLAAGQGYVLQGKAGEHYTLTEVTEAVDYNVNILKGVVEQTNCEDLLLQGTGDYAYPWILAKDGTFKRYTGAYIPAGKAYLDGALLQNLGGSGAATMRVILEEDEVTALSQLNEEKATVPCYYNLQGQRVAQPRQAGTLYIESNGRKIIVK